MFCICGDFYWFVAIQVGDIEFVINFDDARPNSYIVVGVTSKSRDEKTLPIKANCWPNTGIYILSFLIQS